MTTLIIDADPPLYQALINAESEVEFDEDQWMLTSDHQKARTQFNDRIEFLIRTANADDYILCFSDKDNFRKGIYPEYKSNRKKTRKPLGFLDFKFDIMETYNSTSKPRLEADDVVGILGTKMSDVVIFSEDKDLMQIPCLHLIEEQVVEVTAEEGLRFHMIQTLMGDAVDGYPGCPGIGKVKAEKIIAGCSNPSEWWPAVLDTYASAGLTPADALMMARVAKILQVNNWDKEKQEVILWEPPIA